MARTAGRTCAAGMSRRFGLAGAANPQAANLHKPAAASWTPKRAERRAVDCAQTRESPLRAYQRVRCETPVLHRLASQSRADVQDFCRRLRAHRRVRFDAPELPPACIAVPRRSPGFLPTIRRRGRTRRSAIAQTHRAGDCSPLDRPRWRRSASQPVRARLRIAAMPRPRRSRARRLLAASPRPCKALEARRLQSTAARLRPAWSRKHRDSSASPAPRAALAARCAMRGLHAPAWPPGPALAPTRWRRPCRHARHPGRNPDSDRPPSVAMLPAPRLLARVIESGGFAWPTFPAVAGARHRKFSTDEDA